MAAVGRSEKSDAFTLVDTGKDSQATAVHDVQLVRDAARASSLIATISIRGHDGPNLDIRAVARFNLGAHRDELCGSVNLFYGEVT